MKALDDFTRFYAHGNNMVRKLIIVNVLAFLAINIVKLIIWATGGGVLYPGVFDFFISFVSVPADLQQLILRFWTPVVYGFFHEDFFHLVFNMLYLYFLGNIFKEYLGNGKTLATFFWGSLVGAGLYVLAFNTVPGLSGLGLPLIGASAGVMAIVIGICAFLPYYEVAFFSFFIPLRWVAVAILLIDFITLPNGNLGGHIAHWGGALYGFMYARYLRRNSALGSSIEDIGGFVGKLFKRKSKQPLPKKEPTVYSNTTYADFDDEYEPNQEEIDAILDKINQTGYESLSRTEREMLFKASRQH